MSSRRAATWRTCTCTTQSVASTVLLACLSLLSAFQTVQAYELAYEPCASIQSYWNCFQNEACIWHPIKVSDDLLLLIGGKFSSARSRLHESPTFSSSSSALPTHVFSIFVSHTPRDNASISARDGRSSSAWHWDPVSACGYRFIRETMVAFAPMWNEQLPAK